MKRTHSSAKKHILVSKIHSSVREHILVQQNTFYLKMYVCVCVCLCVCLYMAGGTHVIQSKFEAKAVLGALGSQTRPVTALVFVPSILIEQTTT
jgi:hypothetical protein